MGSLFTTSYYWLLFVYMNIIGFHILILYLDTLLNSFE